MNPRLVTSTPRISSFIFSRYQCANGVGKIQSFSSPRLASTWARDQTTSSSLLFRVSKYNAPVSSTLNGTLIRRGAPFTTDAALQKEPKSAKAENTGEKESKKRDGGEKKAARSKPKAKPKPKPTNSVLRPPKIPPSPWQIYLTEYLNNYRASHPGEKLEIIVRTREASEGYKSLGAEAMEVLKKRSKMEKETYNKEYAAWEKTLTPDAVRRENQVRAAKRRAGKSRKGNLRDPNAPKKPSGAYLLFLRHVRSDPVLSRELYGEESDVMQQSSLAAYKWRSLTPEERQPFLSQSEEEKAVYNERLKEYLAAHGTS